jgi:hypothetical protein
MWIVLSSPLECAQRNCLKWLTFRVLSVWRKTSVSESVLFRTVLSQVVSEPIMSYELKNSFQKLKNLTNKRFAKSRMR